MEGMNKFKVLMVIVVFMFLFVVAAIYTNTKEAARDKVQAQKQSNETTQQQEYNESASSTNSDVEVPENISSMLGEVSTRLDSLTSRVENIEADMKYSCKVYGVVSDNGIEQLSPEAAIDEARNNGKEFVMSCSF